MLVGKVFEGVDTLEYLKKDIIDDEIECLTRNEFNNLFTKAFVVICSQLQEETKLLREVAELERLILKHYEIYPDLINAKNSEADFKSVKARAEIKKIEATGFLQFIDKLPEIKKMSQKKSGSNGGVGRVAKDPMRKSQAMEAIKAEYLAKWETGYRFPRGQLTEFYKQKAKDYSEHELEVSSIKNAIEKYRGELGHTVAKKQSS